MIRELITALWAWRRDAAMAAGKQVMDPECLKFRFLSWLFCPSAKRQKKAPGRRGRGPRPPMRQRYQHSSRWQCMGCGEIGYALDEDDAHNLAWAHSAEHDNQYAVPVLG